MGKIKLNVPINRVEGDLEVHVELEDNTVSDAWCSGTMYRGIENILVGRGALDGLVITPRICGICTTAHLTAAALALDMIGEAVLPSDAVRIRNLALATEQIQSDIRQTFLMYAVDFTDPVYQHIDLYDQAVSRYEPFKGSTIIEVIKETKTILEIIAIIGGQWPHSSYMVPGGIVSIPSKGDLIQCDLLLKRFRQWYERQILGCSLERWGEVKNQADLEAWLEEKESHRNSDLGFFIRYSRKIGLHRVGKNHDNFISFGSLDLPDQGKKLIPAAYASGNQIHSFNQEHISEHVAHSWFKDYENGLHPAEGLTQPYASGEEGQKYSWAKAPRYEDNPAETGPLAEMIVSKNPLFTNLISQNGSSAFLRQLARLVRPTILMSAMESWINDTVGDGKFYQPPGEIVSGVGHGLVEVSRGALGHWVQIENKKIKHYQIITPTAWNASPRDSKGTLGPIEQALIGASIQDMNNPVELGHIIRSFDPCLVCTVHSLEKGHKQKLFTVQC